MGFLNLIGYKLGTIGIYATAVIVLAALAFVGSVLGRRVWKAAGELVYPVRRTTLSSPTDYGAVHAEPVSFKSRDGLTLRGWFSPAPGPAKGTIVCSHGYAGDCLPDLIYAPMFYDAGYNVLFFDYRGHGASEGKFTSLVYFERGDLLCALQYLRSRGIERVGLIGFSMGGAITLSTAPLCPMVIGAISDSTFGELNRIIRAVAEERGTSPAIAALLGYLVEAAASLRLHANLFAADPIRHIAKISPCPVLIMHGQADEAVPVSEAFRLYRAAREPKELWIVPGAHHRRIEDIARQEYRRRVIEFFDRAFVQSSSPG